MEDLDFSRINKLVNYRYVTGQCSDMSEVLEFTKIQLLNSRDNCIKRVTSWGYLICEKEHDGIDKNVEFDDGTFFIDRLNLAKIRYLTGKSKNLKEIFEVLKIIVNQDVKHNIKKLISDGFKVVNPMDLKENECEKESFDYGQAFDYILGKPQQ